MIKRMFLSATCLILALILCSAAFAADKDFPLTVEDALGRSVTVPAPPERIISLAPSITESLYGIGAGDQVVGVTTYCNYPPEAASVEKIGDINLNYEKIIALEPDLVVGDVNLQSKGLKELIGLGVPVLAVGPTTYGETIETLELLGKVTGHSAQAQSVANEMTERARQIQEKVASIPGEDRPLVFIEIWNQPLMTAGPGSFMDELVTMAGGINAAARAPGAWVEYSVEKLIAQNPDVIITTMGNTEEIKSRPVLSETAAVLNGRVYAVDPDIFNRPGPRLDDALTMLAEILYPDQF